MQTTRDQAIDVLVELLGEYHGAIPAAEFYDSLCAAVCRLTRLRRAALLLYDDAAVFLLSNLARAISDEILHVNRGAHAVASVASSGHGRKAA